jgi:hypothetical protein
MPSTSETGHAKNVANFEDLISFCTAYGAAYNPSKESLTVIKLKELETAALQIIQQVKTNKTGFDNATNARQIAFKDLKPLSTKIVNALAVSGASKLVLDDAKTVNRKIQGTRASSTAKKSNAVGSPTSGELEGASISTSQQSYDSLIDHFTKIIETITQESSYTPNETELKTTALQTKLANLKTTNTNLINGYTDWSNARIQRNATLYNPLTGLLQTALEVKKYVKSVFGASSPQFKQVSGLKFTNSND